MLQILNMGLSSACHNRDCRILKKHAPRFLGWLRVGIALFTFFAVTGNFSSAGDLVKSCASVKVQSVVVSEEQPLRLPLDSPPEITLVPKVKESISSDKTKIIAIGPVLSLLDSREIKTETECTKSGFIVTAHLIHIGGSAAKNPPWRPKIEAITISRLSGVTAQVKWRLQAEDGTDLDHYPGSPDKKFPLTTTKTLR